MPLLTRFSQYRILKLTKKYQQKHPAIEMGTVRQGRIALEKRPEYYEKCVRILVSDKTLVKYLTDTSLDTPLNQRQVISRIAQFFLQKARGNKVKAKEMIKKEMEKVLQKTEIDEKVLEKKAKKMGLNPLETEIYVAETDHMYNSVVTIVRQILRYSRNEIEK